MTVLPADAKAAAVDDPFDPRLAMRAKGLLEVFNRAGVLAAADVHVASRLGRLGGEPDERVLLAAALAVRGVRLGSVCVPLSDVRGLVTAEEESDAGLDALPWPEPAEWLALCSRSPLVIGGPRGNAQPLRLEADLLYLDRYWRQEDLVREQLDSRAVADGPLVDTTSVARTLAELFPRAAPDRQRLAVATAVLRSLTVVAGGPGTGKTTTVARLLEVLQSLPEPPRVALAAPTGKAAARLEEAVREHARDRGWAATEVSASTLHRLLGRRPESRSRFRHNRNDRLPFDVVVVDETSMVSLTMMSRLMEALRPQARLVLVGDPNQLASVEVGAVLADIVDRPGPADAQPPAGLAELVPVDAAAADPRALRTGVVWLTDTHRFGTEIGDLAKTVQAARPDEVLALLRAGGEAVSYLEVDDGAVPSPAQLAGVRDDVVTSAKALTALADEATVTEALAALDRHRLLCAHRRGPAGVESWREQVERWLAEDLGLSPRTAWYRGQPLLVTANDYDLQLFNGDSGVVVDAGERGLRAAFARATEPLLLPPARLSQVQTMHAMTVHRSQGSQFDRVTLVLPASNSRLLTRELLYTAVTRAQSHVRVIGSAAAVRRAVTRRVARASGLRST